MEDHSDHLGGDYQNNKDHSDHLRGDYQINKEITRLGDYHINKEITGLTCVRASHMAYTELRGF